MSLCTDRIDVNMTSTVSVDCGRCVLQLHNSYQEINYPSMLVATATVHLKLHRKCTW